MSHYAEKARFALVRTGLPWREIRHVQGPHYFTSLRVGRSLLLPILRDGEDVICDSTAILHHLDAKLPSERRLFTGDPRVVALEDEFDGSLGVHSRKLVYFYIAQNREQFLDLACQGTPAWERAFMSVGFAVAKRLAFARLEIDDIGPSVDMVRRHFDDADRRLASTPYLVGDRFTAADLAFACLGAPLALPPEYGVRLPTLDTVVPAFASLIRELRARPSGQFILRMFREEKTSVQT